VSSLKRVLVTGAGGFIGRHSVSPLLQRGFEVHACISKQNEVPAELIGTTVHRANLLDDAEVEALLTLVAPTHLLHFAWIATPGVYWQSSENFLWAKAGMHLMRRFRAQGGIRAVMAGSCAEYDWSQGGVYLERGPLAEDSGTPLTPYAAGKIDLRNALTEFSRVESMSFAWGRIFFQFGPYEHPDRLVPSVIRHLLLGQEALCTHGRQVRSFLHAVDVGAAFASVLDSGVQGPVNIGSDEPISLAELIQRIARQIDRVDLVRLGARATPEGEPSMLLPDVHRLHNEVKWRPGFSLNEGLADCIAWWRQNLKQARPK
jgi:UDP-glucuronate decarboxylase